MINYGVSFDMYVAIQSSDNVVLNQQPILQAVEVNIMAPPPCVQKKRDWVQG